MSSTAIAVGGQLVGLRLMLTAEKWRFVPIGECTWDNGGHVPKSGLSTCTETFL